MFDFINQIGLLYSRLSPWEQFWVFLAAFIPFIIVTVIQMLIKKAVQESRRKNELKKAIISKHITVPEQEDLSLLFRINQKKPSASFLKYSSLYWGLVRGLIKHCILTKQDPVQIIPKIRRVKELAFKIFGVLPNRFWDSTEIPLKTKAVIEFPRLNQKIDGIIEYTDLHRLKIFSQELYMIRPTLLKGEKVIIHFIIRGIGSYTLNTLYIQETSPLELEFQSSFQLTYKNFRRFERFKTELPAYLMSEKEYSPYCRQYKGFLINISRGGAKFCYQTDYPDQKDIVLRIESFKTSISLNGVILGKSYSHETNQGYAHIKFKKLEMHQKNQLTDLLFKLKEEEKTKKKEDEK